MPCYYERAWHEGDSREQDGDLCEDQWSRPVYRPGWRIKYRKLGKLHVGKIRYVVRDGPERLDHYIVLRTKTGELEITYECLISERLSSE